MKTILTFIACLIPIACMARVFEDQEVTLLPITPALEASAIKALQGYVPLNNKPVGEINKNGVYTLTGNLFHDHRTYAVVDDNQDVLVCQWLNSKWSLLSAVNVETDWNFPTGYREITGRTPDNQQQPFWMIDLQGHPLLVIASSVEKEGQYYYIILLDSDRTQLVTWDSSFSLRPEVKDGYLLTGDASRVKSESGATYYSKIQNNKFVMLKSWEDSQPWHAEDHEGEPDDTSNHAISGDKGYLILPDNRKSAHPADYIVVRSDPKEKQPEIPLPADLGGRPYAAVYFTPNRITQGDDGLVYLFEKLTELPATLYPSWGELGDGDLVKKSEPQWNIRVTGTDPGLIKLLSGPSNDHQTNPPQETNTIP